jgi:regulator of cell morphogenesis and NO signaling
MLQISEDTIVNHLIEDVPGALEVFRRHGIDSCCGGHLTLEKAARTAGIDPYRLMSELRLEAVAAQAASEEVSRHF